MGRSSEIPRVQFPVRVIPRASQNQVEGWETGRLRVRLTAPPVGGRANEALRDLLAAVLGVSRRCVRILRGERSRDKWVEVEGLTREALQQRLPGAP